MNKKIKIASIVIIIIALIGIAVWYLSGLNFEVLNPKGPIALKERNLIYFALGLSLFVVIPVFAMTIGFAYRYRETNKKAKYSPNLDKNIFLELSWWIFPAILITILAVVTWTSSHQLDPFKPISSNKKPLNIEVVALDWRWLFIYPKSNIATVDYFKFPVNRPVTFYITSDAPMNSFWIPQLGGQIYAMAGMSTELNLMATSTGNYRGLSANISGKGFSSMLFSADAVSNSQYQSWLSGVKKTRNDLSWQNFIGLAKPTINQSKFDYASVYPNLYGKIVNNYMSPISKSSTKVNNNKNMTNLMSVK